MRPVQQGSAGHVIRKRRVCIEQSRRRLRARRRVAAESTSANAESTPPTGAVVRWTEAERAKSPPRSAGNLRGLGRGHGTARASRNSRLPHAGVMAMIEQRGARQSADPSSRRPSARFSLAIALHWRT